jgi:hypothetical protein
MAFYLLRSSGLDPGPGIHAAQTPAAREGEARLERVCGISGGHRCCTLLLYNRSRLFELSS